MNGTSRVVIYCPDRHLLYDGATLDQRGVGGGVTARLRLAQALAARGHAVSVVCNCPKPRTHRSVRYLPLDSVRGIGAEILILHSTGDRLDLSPVLNLKIEAQLRIVFVDGVDAPGGLDRIPFDYLMAPSNFIRGIAIREWGIAETKIFVSHHGVDRKLFTPPLLRARARVADRIAYATHPSKGLEAAIYVLRLLRVQAPAFELHVYGGHALWGQPGHAPAPEPGLVFHGLIGQPELARELLQAGFALYLQTRPEPFGIAITEALAAGCVTLASPVGAHPEIIDDGKSGFLIPGDPSRVETHGSAASRILAVYRNPAFGDYVRGYARQAPLDWGTIAETWEQFWTWFFQGRPVEYGVAHCSHCGHAWLPFADGYHCPHCGRYSRDGILCPNS